MSVLTYTDEDLEPGKTYYYILQAVNDNGARRLDAVRKWQLATV